VIEAKTGKIYPLQCVLDKRCCNYNNNNAVLLLPLTIININ